METVLENEEVKTLPKVPDIGPVIRAAREKAGLSQMQLARNAGYSRPTVANIENGKGNASLECVSAVCEAAGVSFVDAMNKAEGFVDAEPKSPPPTMFSPHPADELPEVLVRLKGIMLLPGYEGGAYEVVEGRLIAELSELLETSEDEILKEGGIVDQVKKEMGIVGAINYNQMGMGDTFNAIADSESWEGHDGYSLSALVEHADELLGESYDSNNLAKFAKIAGIDKDKKVYPTKKWFGWTINRMHDADPELALKCLRSMTIDQYLFGFCLCNYSPDNLSKFISPHIEPPVLPVNTWGRSSFEDEIKYYTEIRKSLIKRLDEGVLKLSALTE